MVDKINLKTYIEKLMEIQKEEDKYKEIFAQIKKDKDSINNTIIDFMDKNNIKDKDIIFGDKKIKYTSSKVQDTITKKLITDRLKIFLKDENLALNATNFIYADRNNSQKIFLKITDIKK